MALLGVLLAELLIAQFDLSTVTLAYELQQKVQTIIPVVSNFSTKGQAGARAAAFIAVTLLGFPVLVAWAYKWADSHRQEMRRILVVTPLTRNVSWFRRAIFGVMFSLFVLGACWYVFVSFGSDFFSSGKEALRSQVWQYEMVLSGGWKMWFSWVMLHQFIAATAVGGYVWFITEWSRYFGCSTASAADHQ